MRIIADEPYLTAVIVYTLGTMDERSADIPPRRLISALRGYKLLPAIVFVQTRRKCDESAQDLANDRSQPVNGVRRDQRAAMFDAHVADFPEIADHKHAKVIVNAGVASHHAGHIPAWKLLVEKMMSAGLLDAIFATSTVAAGVDFPARTVVIGNADTRGNEGWRPLRASELQQMTGRAGRRGRDNVGFIVLVPGQFQNPRKIADLLSAKPDPLESRFRATYTSLLNLLDAYGNFEQVREIAEKSFAFRDSLKVGNREGLGDRLWRPFENRARILDHFGYLNFEAEKVTDDGKWLADLRVDRPLIIGEAIRAGIFDELTLSETAALIASVASDADRNYGTIRVPNRLAHHLSELETVVLSVARVEWKFGIEPVEELNDSAAATTEKWATGMEWEALVARTKAEPGDLIRLLSRTGEALRQIGNLTKSKGEVAAKAFAAADVLLREPVR